MTAPIRTFIAIDLPPDVKQSLADFTETLKSRGLTGIRWVRPEGVHLTLKFLGNIPPDMPTHILSTLQATTKNHAPFSLTLGSFGVFPNPSNPRVLWVGLKGDLDALAQLQTSVEEQCSSLGLDPDRRPFRPHLTLGRVRRTLTPPQRALIHDALQNKTNTDAPRWTIREIHLIHSTLTPHGAIYRSLGAIPFLIDKTNPP